MVNTAYQWTQRKAGAIHVTGLAFAALLARHACLSAVSHSELAPEDTLATFSAVTTVRANDAVVEVHAVVIASCFSKASYTLRDRNWVPSAERQQPAGHDCKPTPQVNRKSPFTWA